MTARLATIECSNLAYRYPRAARPTISSFSHVFRLGECTAIVGPSGSGKTTLLRLILRTLSPDSGTLYANDKPYGEIDVNSLRANFAVLMQSAHLFPGTIREILTELKPDSSDSELMAALGDVGLHPLVSSLPDGLETQIDEAGGRLSGGQRTRLLLARALLSGRRLLVLDEPFANIDQVSKKIILNALRDMKPSHIIIVVTHDELLLDIADHVVSPTDWAGSQQVSVTRDASRSCVQALALQRPASVRGLGP